MSWLTWRTTDRSCAMKRYATPRSRCRRAHQVDHLGLGRHVERAHRLVAHHETGVDRERARDRESLQLTTGELVRVPGEVVTVEPDHFDELGGAVFACATVHRFVRTKGFSDARTDGRPRVERRVRVLEDHLRVPTDGPELAPRSLRDVAAVDVQFPAVDPKSRSTQRPSVDFPDPDSPTSPRVCPGRISKSTPSTPRAYPWTRRRMPLRIGKCFVRPRASTSAERVHADCSAHARCSASVTWTRSSSAWRTHRTSPSLAASMAIGVVVHRPSTA